MGFLKAIIARVGMDATDFELGAKKVEGVAKHMGEEVAHRFKGALGAAFGVAAIEEGLRSVIEYSAHIKDMADQTDISTAEVQRLGYAARTTGLQFEDFQTALSKVGSARKEAAEKNDALVATFKKFGITLDDLQDPAMRNIDLLYKISAAIQHMDMTAGDRQALREFFGKSGDKLMESIANIDKIKDRAIISDKDIQAIDKLDKSVDRLFVRLKVFAAGPIGDVTDKIANLLDTKADIQERAMTALKLLVNPGQLVVDGITRTLLPPSADHPVATAGDKQLGPELPTGEKNFENQRGKEAEKVASRINIEAEKKEAANSMIGVRTEQREKILKLAIKDIDSFQGPEMPEAQARRRKHRADLVGEELELERGEKGGRNLTVDHLTKMGGFVGGAENVMANIARDNLAANRATASNTAAMAKSLAEIPKGDTAP